STCGSTRTSCRSWSTSTSRRRSATISSSAMATDLINRRVIRVPNVVGRSYLKARILLEDAGFKNIVALYRESYEDRDTVLDQKPSRTQMVYEDTEVTIWVARRGYLES